MTKEKQIVKNNLIFLFFLLFAGTVFSEERALDSLLNQLHETQKSETFYVALGIALFEEEEGVAVTLRRAQEKAAIIINRHKSVDVVSRRAHVKTDQEDFDVIVPTHISNLENIVQSIALTDYIFFGNYFIGLYIYPSGAHEASDINVDTTRRAQMAYIQASEITMPSWAKQSTVKAYGVGEDFCLIYAYFYAYEDALFNYAQIQDVRVNVMTEKVYEDVVDERLKVRDSVAMTMETLLRLEDICITHVQIYQTFTGLHRRYRVYVNVEDYSAIKINQHE